MSNSISLRLHQLKCIEKQELIRDEIAVWGVMVCNNGLTTVSSPLEMHHFWLSGARNFNPPHDFMTISLSDEDVKNNIVVARAALWIVEMDNGKFWEDGAPEAKELFDRMFLEQIRVLHRGHEAEALKNMLPDYHRKLNERTSAWWIDDDEVFPYINTEFRGTQLPPLHSEDSAVAHEVRKRAGGEYSLDSSWSLKVG